MRERREISVKRFKHTKGIDYGNSDYYGCVLPFYAISGSPVCRGIWLFTSICSNRRWFLHFYVGDRHLLFTVIKRKRMGILQKTSDQDYNTVPACSADMGRYSGKIQYRWRLVLFFILLFIDNLLFAGRYEWVVYCGHFSTVLSFAVLFQISKQEKMKQYFCDNCRNNEFYSAQNNPLSVFENTK